MTSPTREELQQALDSIEPFLESAVAPWSTVAAAARQWADFPTDDDVTVAGEALLERAPRALGGLMGFAQFMARAALDAVKTNRFEVAERAAELRGEGGV